jgi:hypothetical protein
MSELQDDYEGYTLREIAIKTYEKVLVIEREIPHFVTWPKLGAAAATIAGIVIAIIKL